MATPDNPLVGAAVLRKEDGRLLTGRGRYVSDMVLPGMVHAVFVRSPWASAEVKGVDGAAAGALPGVVAVVDGSDPAVAPVEIVAVSTTSGYLAGPQPILARRVRFAGEAVAVVAAETLPEAVDAAQAVEVDYEPRPAVVDALTSDELFLTRRFEAGDVDGDLAGAALVVRRTFTTNRQCPAPIEGRATLASWDPSAGRLTVWTGTQVPHIVRHGLSEVLGLPERHIRVVAPDVGGGFGGKTALYPEDVAVCLLARRLGRPVKWVETRTENLAAASHARDHHYEVAAGFAADGTLVALDARIRCDVGAYSLFPWTAGLEPLMAGGLLPGPYKVASYRAEVAAVATNKAPAGPYRGVARPATVFVMERLLDIAAGALGLDRAGIRRRNLVGAEDLPYTAATRLVHDSPTYPTALERVLDAVGYDGFAKEQEAAREAGNHLGLGLAVYNELTGLGRASPAGPRIVYRTGHEAVTVRLDPSGGATVVSAMTSQGQGMETTLAQVVAGELGLSVDDVDVRLGDTDTALSGFGAFASRQGVIGSGAGALAARDVRDKVLLVAAHLLEAAPGDLEITDGRVAVRGTPARSVTVADMARVAYFEAHRLPPGVEAGLEATRFFDPEQGTFAAGALAVVVEVDRDTGAVALRRVVCAEDAGRALNPVVVEGQIHGAVAQGLAGALYEHLCYDGEGQLVTATLMDYLVPSAADLPSYEVHHCDVPSATNPYGVRGVGEGGTLGPGAAVANAVADALGVEVNHLPVTPGRVHQWLLESEAKE
ncbi:MAG: xanthine dehydrogenase family protein molybdopterin-binding subunit [Actinomycetota bacterium]|nr:xanthine dehydrogenase family protein molybdopterin-binding subunit [Actinomycetota bacterium]